MPDPAPVINTVRSEPAIRVLLSASTATLAAPRERRATSGELCHAVDIEDRPGDVVRLLGGQVGDGGGDVLRRAELPQWHAQAEGLGSAGHEPGADVPIALGTQHRRVDRTGRHRVDGNAVA